MILPTELHIPKPVNKPEKRDDYSGLRDIFATGVLSFLGFKASEDKKNIGPALFTAFLYGANREEVDNAVIDIAKTAGLVPKRSMFSRLKDSAKNLLAS